MPLPEFQQFQYAFAAHIRDPRAHPRPRGIEMRRMKIYNDLVYNNVEGFLLACYPVLRKVLGKHKWTKLVRAFISIHRSHTPYFRQIPDEFLQFLQAEWARPDNYPEYLVELAHYEWIELMLSVSNRSVDGTAIDPHGNLLEQRPILNPVLANLQYRWPVQRIRPRMTITPAGTHLLVFRDSEDQIRFVETNAFTARLLSLLETGDYTGRAALQVIIEESGHAHPARVMEGGLTTLQNLRQRGAILGASPAA